MRPPVRLALLSFSGSRPLHIPANANSAEKRRLRRRQPSRASVRAARLGAGARTRYRGEMRPVQLCWTSKARPVCGCVPD